MAQSTKRPPRMLRDISTCRCRKSIETSFGTIGMPMWLRGEAAGHVDAEDHQLHAEERGAEPGAQGREHQHRPADEADGEHRDLGSAGAVTGALPSTVCTALTWRLSPSSVVSGQNSQPWRAVSHRVRPLRAAASSLVKISAPGRDVVVGADLVGVGVVARVLVHPPAVAEPDHEVAGDARGPLVGLARREDLAVRAVVGEERGLGEEDAEQRRDRQLPPGLAEGQQERERHREGDERGRAHGRRTSRCGGAAGPRPGSGARGRCRG